MDNLLNIFVLVIAIILIISMWRIFEKAGRKGWEALIPIYNLFIIFQLM